MSAVICREIDSHRVMEVELVLKDDQLRTLFIGEQVSSRVVFQMEQVCEDVVFELRNELLCGNQWPAASPCQGTMNLQSRVVALLIQIDPLIEIDTVC